MSLSVRISGYTFGSVHVDGVTYEHDLIIDRGKIRKRKKGASRKFRGTHGHTPLSAAEDIPWRCRRLVIGTGADGRLPVMKQVHDEARRREVDLGHPAHRAGDRRADRHHRGHQRHLAPDVLNSSTRQRPTATRLPAWFSARSATCMCRSVRGMRLPPAAPFLSRRGSCRGARTAPERPAARQRSLRGHRARETAGSAVGTVMGRSWAAEICLAGPFAGRTD
jgi:hypothetical protein